MIDNQERGRFELPFDEGVVFANYRRSGATIMITHVEAPPALRGTGRASRLMQEIADHARAERIPLRPLCSYAAAWFRRHRDYADVLA